MSERGGVLRFGGNKGFLWESQPWAFSNSDNSEGDDDNKSHKITLTSTSMDNLQIKIGMDNGTKKKKIHRGKKRDRNGGSIGSGSEGTNEGEQDEHDIHIWTERERRKKMRNMFANLHALLPQLPPKADKSSIVDEAVNYIKTLQNTLQRLQKQKQERQLQVQAAAAGLTATTLNTNYEPPMMLIPSRLSIPSHGVLETSNKEPFLADPDQGCSSNSSPCNLGIAVGPRAGSSSAAAGTFPMPRLPITFQTWTSSNVVLNVCGDSAQITVCSTRKPGLFTKICFVLEQHKIEVISAHVSSDTNCTIYMIQAHVSGTFDRLSEMNPVEEVFKQAAAEIMLWVSS